MNKILFILLICSSSLITTASANEVCRSLIVSAYSMFGVELDPMSFSSAKFENMNVSVESFNLLTSEEQQVIYNMLKPMSASVATTIGAINSIIDRYKGTQFEFMYAVELSRIRIIRDQLRACGAK